MSWLHAPTALALLHHFRTVSQREKQRRQLAIPATLCGLAAVTLICIIGCNSVHVIQSNLERSAQNRGQPKDRPWPAHPQAPDTSARQNEVGPALSQLDVDDDSDEPADEIIPAAAQSQLPAARPSQVPNGTGSISGRVVDPSGRPQPYVSLVATATRRGSGSRAEASTDALGNYVLRGLEPGQRYLILATATRSPTALIGRVTAVASQQGVTIAISRPFTSDLQTEQTSQQPPEPSRTTTPTTTATTPPTDSPATKSFHRADPFSQAPASTSASNPPSAPPAANSSAQRTTTKQTRSQAAADNRLAQPWDMPAPPTRKTSEAPKAASTQTRPAEPAKQAAAGEWRQAGSARNTPKAPPAFSLLDSTPPASLNKQPARSDADQEPGDSIPSDAANPNRSNSQPIELDADARPERPRGNVTKPHVPLEPTSVKQTPPAQERPRTLHERPMCQMEGKRLVDFQLNDIEGRPVCFDAIDSRLVLLDFWTTWCGPCLKAIPHLASLHKRYSGAGLQVIGIACETGEPAERVARVARIRSQLHIPYPLLTDEGDDKLLVRDHFGVDVYPTLILLDKTGKVLWRSEGPDQADLNQLENLLKTQLNPAPVRYN